MPKSRKSPPTVAETEELPDDEWPLPREYHRLALLALRAAASLEGAPARCSRRDCRNGGHCLAEYHDLDTWGEHTEIECGGGITERMLRRAADMIGFLRHLARLGVEGKLHDEIFCFAAERRSREAAAQHRKRRPR